MKMPFWALKKRYRQLVKWYEEEAKEIAKSTKGKKS